MSSMVQFFDPIKRRFFTQEGEGRLEWLPLNAEDKVPHNLVADSWGKLVGEVEKVLGKGWKVGKGALESSSWSNGTGSAAVVVYGPEQMLVLEGPEGKDPVSGEPVKGPVHNVPVFEVGKHYDFGGVEGLKFWASTVK